MAPPVAAFTVIPLADVDPDSPVSTNLMDGLRLNDQNLFAQLVGDPVSAPPFTPEAAHNHDGVNSAAVAGANLRFIAAAEVSVAVTTVSFTGLDGETDGVYKLIGRINHPVGAKLYTVNPNGNGVNVTTRLVLDGAAAVNLGGLRIMNTTAAAGFVGFEMLIHAREVIQATNIMRMAYWKSIDTSTVGAPLQIQDAVGTIQGAIANITSLDIVSSVASGIGIGSRFALYKLAET